jgi:hypothetical protein
MVDKSISFGQQNFLFIKTSDADLTYDYVAYMTRKGSILIARFPKLGDEATYWLGKGVFATVWAAKGTLTYGLPNILVDPTV